MQPLLSLNHVSKTFEDAEQPFEVLRDISLTLEEGAFTAIVGPSGCGKSVLLYLIAGFLKKTSGDLLLNGVPIVRPGTDRMMVFQDYVLLPWKSVYENILFALEKSNFSISEKKKRVEDQIAFMGLSEFKDWPIYKLSGGMKQRVAIARALVPQSKLLLMDEPFSALDSQRRKFLRANLVDIWQKTGTTVLFVTHSVSEAVFLADKIYVMSGRPSVITNEYRIGLPHPRMQSHPDYLALREKILKDLSEESYVRDATDAPEVEAALAAELR